MTKPIVVEVTRQTDRFSKGAILGYDTEGDAKRVLGEGAYKITGHQDGSVYEAPKKSAPKPDKDTT